MKYVDGETGTVSEEQHQEGQSLSNKAIREQQKVSREEEKAKTEFMYVPTREFFKDLPEELPAPSDPNCRQLARRTK